MADGVGIILRKIYSYAYVIILYGIQIIYNRSNTMRNKDGIVLMFKQQRP